jgi:hypothetical protein
MFSIYFPDKIPNVGSLPDLSKFKILGIEEIVENLRLQPFAEDNEWYSTSTIEFVCYNCNNELILVEVPSSVIPGFESFPIVDDSFLVSSTERNNITDDFEFIITRQELLRLVELPESRVMKLIDLVQYHDYKTLGLYSAICFNTALGINNQIPNPLLNLRCGPSLEILVTKLRQANQDTFQINAMSYSQLFSSLTKAQESLELLSQEYLTQALRLDQCSQIHNFNTALSRTRSTALNDINWHEIQTEYQKLYDYLNNTVDQHSSPNMIGFMSSILQILYTTKSFRDHLNQDNGGLLVEVEVNQLVYNLFTNLCGGLDNPLDLGVSQILSHHALGCKLSLSRVQKCTGKGSTSYQLQIDSKNFDDNPLTYILWGSTIFASNIIAFSGFCCHKKL